MKQIIVIYSTLTYESKQNPGKMVTYKTYFKRRANWSWANVVEHVGGPEDAAHFDTITEARRTARLLGKEYKVEKINLPEPPTNL